MIQETNQGAQGDCCMAKLYKSREYILQELYPSKSSVEPVLLPDPLRYGVNILFLLLLSENVQPVGQ